MYKLFLIVLTVISFSSSLYAADKSKMKAAFNLVDKAQIMENIKVTNIDTAIANSKFTPAEIYLNQTIIQESVAASVEQMKTIKWRAQFARAYAKALTIDEMNQLATYYTSPETSAIPEKQAEFVTINQSIVEKEVTKYMVQIKQELEDTFSKLASEDM